MSEAGCVCAREAEGEGEGTCEDIDLDCRRALFGLEEIVELLQQKFKCAEVFVECV